MPDNANCGQCTKDEMLQFIIKYITDSRLYPHNAHLFGRQEYFPQNNFNDKGAIVNTFKMFSMREKCPYLELFWSVFRPKADKYGPE